MEIRMSSMRNCQFRSGINSLLQNGVSHLIAECIRGRKIHANTQKTFKRGFDANKLEQSNGHRKLYQQVNVAGFGCFISRGRAEQPDGLYAAALQLRSMLSKNP